MANSDASRNGDTCNIAALSLIPPSPVTDKIDLEIRAAVRNPNPRQESFQVSVYLDVTLLHREEFDVPGGGVRGISLRRATAGLAGTHELLLEVTGAAGTWRCHQPLEVRPSATRSTRTIGGAWLGFVHWSEAEGAHWNDCLRTFTDDDWRETVRGMHRLGMNVIIVQETWRNPIWYGIDYHTMTAENYRQTYAGRAFYPSRLWPARMDLPSPDPVEAILSEAVRLGMHVMLALGMYAHFDYTPGSLAWHKNVLTELWELYGHHPSLYGWYISEELNGRIKPHEIRYWDRTDEFRDEVLAFFRELSALRNQLAPHTPIMLAPDSYHHNEAMDVWPQLAQHCDIFCVQGYQRIVTDDMPIDENIRRMQSICDTAGSHLWMDMEAFGFEHPDKPGPQREEYSHQLPDGTDEFVHVPLVPQDIELLAAELGRFHQFEFVCTYQYPGIFCAPDAAKAPGGPAAVRLFQEYERYLQQMD